MAANVNPLRDTLEEIVKEVLPHLDSDALELAVDLLIGEGVKKVADLRHMTIQILKQTLDTVDATDLYVYFQDKYGSSVGSCSNVKNAAPTATSASSTSRSNRSVLQENGVAARSVLNSLPTYDKDSHVMTTEIQAAIKAKQRPRSRVAMVNNIVEDMKKKVPNLDRTMFKPVADDLCINYPESFKDTIPVSKIGSESLAKQMQDAFDNKKRPLKATGKNKEIPPSAVGCASWDPPMPENESLASQEGTRLALIDMFQHAKKDWVWREIRKKMEETYYLQRKDINSSLTERSAEAQPRKRRKQRGDQLEEDLEDEPAAVGESTTISIGQLRERWPFLFTLRGLNQHFKLLTGVDMKDLWESYVREKGGNLIEFLATKSEALARERRSMVRAEKAGRGCTKQAALLCMLSLYFKEDWKTLVIFTEPTTSFCEIADAVNFPDNDFPMLVVAGESVYHSDKFYVCVEKQAVALCKNISEAIIMLFEIYFLHHKFACYPDTNVNFFYFLQRVIASIIPITGRKASSAAKHKSASDKVNKMNNKFVEYVQMLDEEANEENN